ncbi:hypothetical protein SLEP1_g3315 [Rubroshorea leprosula]|uniref:Ion transport domain-containing protein n=1 Tax=Rubroshorea leprosula TaxID=152421 RepID=A0AAV5HKF2_9ROSI|nr:hypothetical protein SLEP1_g3315 [Rubroshorea leprosula]
MEEIGEDERGIRSSSFVNGVVDPEEEETSVLRRESAFNILNPLGSYSKVWKGVFLLSSAIALWLDPLLLKVDEDAWKNARRYLLSCFFLIDILSILPLPQVLILITPAIKGSRVLVAMDLLKYFVISQFVPRILRLYPLYTRGKGAFGALAEAAWVKALLNLFLYMLASHVIGALWYFLAIERETKCWREACGNQPGCVSDAFICDVTLGNHTFLNDLCPISDKFPPEVFSLFSVGYTKSEFMWPKSTNKCIYLGERLCIVHYNIWLVVPLTTHWKCADFSAVKNNETGEQAIETIRGVRGNNSQIKIV